MPAKQPATSLEIFHSIFFKQIHLYQILVGTDALTENFRPHKWTVFFCLMDVSYMLFNVYTVCSFDLEVQLKCMAIVGLGFQGFAKFPSIIGFARHIYDMAAFLRRIYECNQSPQAPGYAILLRWVRLMNAIMRIGSVIIIAAALLYVPENLLESWQAGKRMPMLNCLVPFVPIDGPGNLRNYAAVYVYHAVLVFLGGVGTCAVDMLLVMFVLHMLPLAELFERQLNDLNAVLRAKSRSVQRGRRFRQFFRNILLMHAEISDYLNEIADVYFFIFFVEIYADALALIVLIVCYIQITWVGMYPLFLLFWMKLFAYCVVGTVAELCTDRMYAALVGCDWYELPLEQRKHFLVMLLAAQRPAVLMAGTVPLNLDTFVNVSVVSNCL